jgi:predicted nuclease with TOPRIM domain
MNFNDLTRKFLSEAWSGVQAPSAMARFRAIKESLQALKPRTIKEKQKLSLALENLSKLRREHRKLNEQVRVLSEENSKLQEQLMILEEGKED